MKKLIVIGGATATGKTALAIQLAQQLQTEILSADSRQFYREMSIGTAKPSAEELAAAKHHFIDFLSVTDDYSVGDFERDALACLEQIYEHKDVAILVGGSGLYIRAVCEGLDKFPDISQETKDQVSQGEAQGGLSWLQTQLQALDPVHFAKVDQQNPARLRRALEVCLETGQAYSSFLQRDQKTPRPFQIINILLEMPRASLYARIDTRVEVMLQNGLEAEVRSLVAFQQRPPLHTVGYEEFFDYFNGLTDRHTAIEKIKQHSRNYAKRQVTWFAKHGDWQKFQPEQVSDILAFVKFAL